MNNKILIAVICLIAYLYSSGKLTGLMPESAPAKQSGNFFGSETPYTMQRAEDASRQRANSDARNQFWNSFWHNEHVKEQTEISERNAKRRQQAAAGEDRARQMFIDKALQRFQQSIDNPKP